MKISYKKGNIGISFNKKVEKETAAADTIRNLNVYLVAALILVSFFAWVFYFNQGLTLAYNDARSHLNVARRVFDNLQPGFAQIGSVWLPLYHVLELPFIWNEYLWHSGIAGSVVSMVAYVLGGVYLLKLRKLLGFGLYATVVSLVVYSLNPNLLFMQTTPMTESLLIFLSIATVYHVVNWAKDLNILDLISAAFFTFLATLTRYDGWFLLFFVLLAVVYISYRKKGLIFAEGNAFFYLTLAGFGIFLWLVWNWAIFGDPLYFVLGPFSAKAQQDILLAEGRLFSKGNLIYSLFLYLLAVVYNVGLSMWFLAIIGIILFIKSKNIKWEIKLATGLLLVPLVFNVISLFAGHSVIHLPGIPPYTWFNDRYGLMLLPVVALAAGFIVGKNKYLAVLVSLVFILQTANMYANNQIITIEDGVKGASGEYLDEASVWIEENVTDGLILVAASSNDALIFKSNLPLKRFITEGAQHEWNISIKNPKIYAEWVIMHKGDLVERNLRNNPNFLKNYELVYKDAFSFIYKRNLKSIHSLTEKELPV